jgi:hypothetical protein
LRRSGLALAPGDRASAIVIRNALPSGTRPPTLCRFHKLDQDVAVRCLAFTWNCYFITMSRFYFHCYGLGDVLEDFEGADLVNEAAARVRAIESLRDLMAADVVRGLLDTRLAIEIQDERGGRIARIGCAEALQILA